MTIRHAHIQRATLQPLYDGKIPDILKLLLAIFRKKDGKKMMFIKPGTDKAAKFDMTRETKLYHVY